MKNLFRPFFDKEHTNRLDFIRYNIIGKNRRKYFDYTASGLAFRQIENRIHDVLETYANTHSKESSNADTTGMYYEQARANLHSHFGLDDDFVVLPSGCGSTAAIKHFQELLGIYVPPATKKRLKLNINKSDLPLVIVGPYEHHSNEISYREAMCETKRVGLNAKGLVDLEQLEEILKENTHREVIGAFCVASNVSGIITPYKEISKILRKYKATVCFDAAAASSYMNIDCDLYDALVCSPHKLLGGPGSCGLLIIRKNLVDTTLSPTFAGGGTVRYVSRDRQDYEERIELREDAGTPGILQLIRASLAYQLRNELGFNFIKSRKEELLKVLFDGLKEIDGVTIYGNLNEENIGIVSFNIHGIDPYELCANLSNSEGIQTRAGCSCAGPYGHDLLGIEHEISIEERPGWVRVGVHYSQTIDEIENLLVEIKKAVKAIN